MGELLFLAVVAIAVISTIRNVRAGFAIRSSLTAIATFVYFACMWIPAHLQAEGLITSKLYKAGLLAPPDAEDIPALCLRWSLELLLVISSEWIVWQLGSLSRRVEVSPVAPLLARPEATALILGTIGVLAIIVTGTPGTADRATEGQGLQTLLRSCLVCGLAILTYYRFFGKWPYLVATVAGVAFLAASNVRSPLFVVFFAYVASEIANDKLRSAKRIAATVSIVVLLAGAGSLMSSVRSNSDRNLGQSFGQVVDATFDNPWTAPFEAGLDTLDGYRFSEAVAPSVDPRPEDLLNVVTTLIPRAIWPDKPTDLAVDLSTEYLNYQGSGQYLSASGYLSLALGSYAAGLVGLALISALFVALMRRFRGTFWTAILLCVEFRFFLGGSSFDLYYGVAFAIPILVVQLSLKLLRPRGTTDIGTRIAVSRRQSLR